MALLWIEGFEGFGDNIGGAPSPTGIIGRKYPVVNGASSFDIEEGRGGSGYSLELNSSSHRIKSATLTTDRTVVLGVAIRIPSEAHGTLFGVTSDGTWGIQIYQTIGNLLKIYRNETYLGAVSTNAFVFNTWYYMELKVYTDNSAGTVDLYVNGSNWVSISGVDTQPGTINFSGGFQLEPVITGTRYDDLYFLDSTGSSNNDVLGNRKVVAIDPDGAGDDSDWAPSAGSNYENVNDGPLLDEDTTYNETSTDAHQDLFTYDDLPANVASVDGVQITTEARITAGSMDLSAVVKTGTTTDTGDPVTIAADTYVTTVRVVEEDPDTASAWTPSGVNGAQFGVLANT